MEAVAEVRRESWAQVQDLPVMEFFTCLAYAMDKQREQQRLQEQYIRKH